jgi:hypothetical protein
MQVLEVECWEEFENKVANLSLERDKLKKDTSLYVSEFLYRGQSDCKWKLETTLDRFVQKDVRLIDYFRTILASKPKIETFTEKVWEIPPFEQYEKWANNFTGVIMGKFLAYEYMAYLRHNGFPSPLLDWSSSPYIAAYFAFNNVIDTDYVSIYVFQEMRGKGKLYDSSEPYINVLGPYVKTHQRHFLQQCHYTICTKIENDQVYYARHENALSINNSEQDILWKVNVPYSERIKVLKKLDEVNINAFSLFGSEESLMDTVAKREFLLKGKYI